MGRDVAVRIQFSDVLYFIADLFIDSFAFFIFNNTALGVLEHTMFKEMNL